LIDSGLGVQAGPSSQTFIAEDGNSLRIWAWPQVTGRPTLHWAHATGFHGRAYAPLLDRLSENANIYAWDMRGHGESCAAGRLDTFSGWNSYYNDLEAWLRAQPEPVWLAGHSIGATASLVAASRVPDKVHGLILCDPVILPPWGSWLLAVSSTLGMADRLSLAAGAKRRRASYPDREAVFLSYRKKTSFIRWPDDWLRAYINTGFIDLPSGNVGLACSPVWESLTFEKTEYRVWRHLKVSRMPALALVASQRSTFGRMQFRRLRRFLPNLKIEVVVESSHFLPMERGDLVERRIAQLLSLEAALAVRMPSLIRGAGY